MKRFPIAPALAVATLLTLGFGPLAQAQYTNGQAASYVIGQSTFTPSPTPTPAATPVPTNSSTLGPQDVSVDNTTGKLFMADSANNRILRFSSAATFVNGASAEAVFGQTSFVTRTAAAPPTNQTMNNPSGVRIDSSGNLWVADSGNNRVLLFTAAATAATNAAAVGVLGQASFTTGTAAVTDRGMNQPYGLTTDSSGTLYVTDRNANRVLRFANAAAAAISAATNFGAPATGIFGQDNYLSGTGGVGPASLSIPSDVALDSSGNLWVSDTLNNRVLRFDNAASAEDGASASLVLGQGGSFTTKTSGNSSSQFNVTSGITFDNVGRLYVSDLNNNRILIFKSFTLTAGGSAAAADLVLGQASFSTTTNLPVTASSLNKPFGLSYLDSGYMWVADSANNRLLSYMIQPGTPSLSNLPANPRITVGTTQNVRLDVQNASVNSDGFLVKIATQKNFSKRGRVKYLVNGVNVTNAIIAGTYRTPELPQNEILRIVMQIRPLKGSSGKLNFTARATSETNAVQTTTQKIAVKIRQKK